MKGLMQKPHFFISRYASQKSHERYVYRAIESIRRFNVESNITVVDDGSEYKLDIANLEDSRINVVDNPFPRSGEVGTLYVARNTLVGDEDVAVTMHDSMVLIRRFPNVDSDIKFLWHFNRYNLMHMSNTVRLLIALNVSDLKLAHIVHSLVNGFGTTCTGCFGLAMCITKRALERLHAEYGIFDSSFMDIIKNRDARQAAERVIGIIACELRTKINLENGKPADISSVCGNIFEHPDPWSFELAKLDLDDLLKKDYGAPMLKTWVGR